MSEKLLCSQCGYSVSPASKFCPNCGNKLERSTPQEDSASVVPAKIVCSSCGTVNPSTEQVCFGCGSSLSVAHHQDKQQPKVPLKSPDGRKKKSERLSITRIVLSLFGLFIVGVAIFELQKSPSGGVQKNMPADAQHSAPITDASVLKKITELEKTLEADPNNSDALLELANHLHDAKFFPRAIETYKKFLTLLPKHTDARVDLGICYFETGDTQRAVGEIEIALKSDPKHQMAMFNLGVIQLSARNLEEAKKWLKKCVDIDPNSTAGQRAQQILSQH